MKQINGGLNKGGLEKKGLKQFHNFKVRQVVMNLRERLSEANEETKSLAKTKQVLERCLEHMIKVSKTPIELPFSIFYSGRANQQTDYEITCKQAKA